MRAAVLLLALFSVYVSECQGLVTAGLRTQQPQTLHPLGGWGRSVALQATTEGVDGNGKRVVTVEVELGKGFKAIETSFRPLFAKSEFVVVSYKVPFSLNVERPPKNFPCPIVTKDGTGGEKKDDVLRATTCFSQGFAEAAGVLSDASAFAGNIKTRRAVFDTTNAQWDQVVAALLSNTEERTDTVTLVFERENSGEN
jgi:hypothetical protein